MTLQEQSSEVALWYPKNKEQSTKDVHFMIDLRTWSMVLQKVLQSTEPHKEPRKNITTKGTRKEPA